MKRFLLVSDLDNAALIRLNEILEKKRREYGTKIMCSTERSLQSDHQLNQEKP
ncbi:MAG: hypothetical protein AB4041_02915 [Microcystaceae cyanobacterium]